MILKSGTERERDIKEWSREREKERLKSDTEGVNEKGYKKGKNSWVRPSPAWDSKQINRREVLAGTSWAIRSSI